MVVDVLKMAVGGAGVARHDGLVIFIPDSAPGDRLEIQITDKKKNHAFAEIVKIITPGPSRRSPPCEYARECGGCNWQHLTTEEQLKQKELILSETLKKFLPTQDLQILPIIKSPRDLRYRNRIQPKYFSGKLGYFKRKSHEILDIKDCLIAENALFSGWEDLRTSLNSQHKNLEMPLRLELSLDQSGKLQSTELGEETEGFGFAQVNRFQNEQLISKALEHSEGSFQRIYDFYAGAGNFTFPLFEKHVGSKVTAIEMSSKLVTRGRALLSNIKTKNKPDFILSSAEHYLKRHLLDKDALVLLDPPRAGASESVMRSLAFSKPKKLIYISCHPVSLARDLAWFFQYAKNSNTQYQINAVQPFEMFPQTDHMETLVELNIDTDHSSDTFLG